MTHHVLGHVTSSQGHVLVSEFGLLGYSFAFGVSSLVFEALRALLATAKTESLCWVSSRGGVV